MSNITYTCAGWAGNWVRGNTSAGPPWSGQKIGAFLCRELQNDNWCGINHTTPHFAPHQVEVNNSTVFPTWNNMFSAPPIFSRKPLLCQLLSCRPALASFLTTTAQGLGWAGLGWLGWVGHRKTTKCQSRSGGRMDGMVQ